MANLPANADMTGTVTQAQFKTALNDLLTFLRDILGSTGAPSNARTALGLGALAVRNDITASELATGAVTEPKLGATAVTEAKIADGAVTLLKIAQVARQELMPVGAVLPVPYNSAPTGWLKCNGAAVSRTTYSGLFGVIGGAYGNGDGSTTFNLPDFRGEFIRGWDDGRGIDSGRTINSHQLDAFQNITGAINNFWRATNSGDLGAFTDVGPAGVSDRPASGGGGTRLMRFDASNSPGARTATETRPRNRALLYIIKY